CKQTVLEDTPTKIPAVVGLRDATEIYSALSGMLHEAGCSLPELDQNKIAAALGTLPDGARCSLCGNTNWTVDTTVYEMREFLGGGLIMGGGAIVPVIILTCTTCGHMNLLNAVALGVLDNTGRAT